MAKPGAPGEAGDTGGSRRSRVRAGWQRALSCGWRKECARGASVHGGRDGGVWGGDRGVMAGACWGVSVGHRARRPPGSGHPAVSWGGGRRMPLGLGPKSLGTRELPALGIATSARPPVGGLGQRPVWHSPPAPLLVPLRREILRAISKKLLSTRQLGV
jgi:hypothetical protein